MSITQLTAPGDRRSEMMAEVRIGLTAYNKHLPSKYFYDARGSQLFEQITTLPEYYLTASEIEILEESADTILEVARPLEIVELGSGSSRKTTLLIEAMGRVGGRRYAPIDISEDPLRAAAKELGAAYDWLEVEAFIGDYLTDLDKVPRPGSRRIVFLDSHVGNYTPTMRHALFRSVRAAMQPGDHFLLGVDLVKDEATMIDAYDDPAGVSAEFNKNVLAVINAELDGDIPLGAFEHRTRFDSETGCMSQSLRATRPVTANIRAIDLAVTFEQGEEIHTEVSCKFDEGRIRDEFLAAGMELKHWLTDSRDYYALALGAPLA